MSPAAIPVHILTGFLGSGKTTLLNRLLAAPALGDSAVIVNEFGDVAVDHALVTEAAEDLMILQSGCICCSVRGDLVDALGDLAGRRKAGLIPEFARVVVETTGLADPGPVIQTLMTEPALAGRFSAASVTATIEAVNGPGQLARHDEARRQIAAADRIVLTKLDIAGDGARAAVCEALGAINPTSPVLDRADFDADTLLAAATPALPDVESLAGHRHGGIAAHCLVEARPLRWAGFARWLDSLTALRGADVLRIKGIVRAREFDRPIAVNGVHHLLHEPVALEGWPDGRMETRLVVITQGIDGLDLRRSLAAAGA